MRLICPSCGAVSSADTFANDDLCRQALVKVAALPGPLPQVTLSYLSLFRAGTSRGLIWKKTIRLVTEIEALVAKGYVHVQGRVDRSCTPATWARGMEQMVEQRAFLRLPMDSHGYLEKVVWDLADKADARHEVSTQVSALQHQRPVTVPQVRGVDPLEKARAEWDRTHGTPQVKGFDELAKIVGGIGNVKE